MGRVERPSQGYEPSILPLNYTAIWASLNRPPRLIKAKGRLSRRYMVLLTRFERATSALPKRCSTY